MANATPSQSFKLGAQMQEQLGDLKGAAKTLKEEARAAEDAAKAAQREIKALERRQKSGEKVDLSSVQERMVSKKFEADQKKQRAKDLTARDKEQRKFKNDVDKRFGGFERAATSQLYSVKDSLDMVSRKLSASNGAAAQFVGGKIAAASAKISPQLIGTVARFAGPVGAAVAGYKIGSKYVKAQHEFRDRGKQISDIKGMTAEAVAAEAKTLVTQDLPKAFLKQLNETGAIAAKKGAGDVAREDIIQADLGAMFRDNQKKTKFVASLFGGPLGSLLNLLPNITGASSKELRVATREAERTKEQQFLRQVGAQYGQTFADKISLDALMGSKEGQGAFQKYLEEDRSILELLGDVGDKLLDKEEFMRKWADKVQQSTYAGEGIRRAQDKATAAQNPEAVSERHIRSTRRSGLERQRLRREMQVHNV